METTMNYSPKIEAIALWDKRANIQLWRDFRIQTTQCFLLFSQSPAERLGEATIGGTCASVQTFVPYKGFTESDSLHPHKQCYVL